ncbi:methyltransferase [uncultured Bacteroides sp.]|uniref:tRNA1(Val) (adenine(37)-N6)-methyltransferase n=1 Tax=uncultured Bacteroides sp. TaxID=162156 RepID=UPI002AAA9CA2|nr:methyltransferase [uncultured Bacteroides sp.]
MANSYFQFKQFTVWHDKCGMKVGTDSVLLGAWTRVEGARRILDIGTGTGLVALMLAQRCEANIIGVEIDNHAAEQAKENIARSPWTDRLSVARIDVKEYSSEEKFKVITSNPPYFFDSLTSPDEQRTLARHGAELTYEELFTSVARLLASDGEFTIVIPAKVATDVIDIAFNNKLYPIRKLWVHTKPETSPKRVLLTFAFLKKESEEQHLLIELERHQYSPEYIALTREYYLKM